ncbi:ftsX-like permease family protein [Synechococcus sp. NOUM97013]|nr:ftsX-like permease family protein [Synechococcus sp. NOUM97013]
MFFVRLVLRNISRRLVRSMVLITAVGLVAAMGFLSVLDLGGLQQSMELGFERLGADLLVVDRTAKVNLTQALLAVEPDTPALPMEVLEAAAQLPPSILLSTQRAVRGDAEFATNMGLSHGASIPLYGIDPEHDSTVQPWLNEQRGIDFQDGQVILGHRLRGRLGDRLRLQGQTFQIYGHLAASGVPSHEHGLFFTLRDLNNLVPSGDPDTLGINGLLVQAPPEFTIERLRFSLLAQLPDASVTGGRTLLAMVRQGGQLSLKLVSAFSVPLLSSVLLLISLYSFGIAAERRQELGLLLSLGATPRQLMGLLTAETSLLCAAGSGLGIGLASLLRQPLEQLLALRLLEAGLTLPHPSPAQLVRDGLVIWLLITAVGTIASALSALVLVGSDPLRLVQSDG